MWMALYHENGNVSWKGHKLSSRIIHQLEKPNMSHDVTITLFSRVYYDAEILEEFPQTTHDCIKQDHKNRFLSCCLPEWALWGYSWIKYRDYVCRYKERQQTKLMINCRLSNSAVGNFLDYKIESNERKNSSSMFESEAKSFTFWDDLSTLTSEDLSSKLSVSHDTFFSSSITYQNILENHEKSIIA